MEQNKAMESILRQLIRRRGLDYLKDGSYFVNAFEELGGTAADSTLLRYLVQSGGHIALLDAEGQTPAMRQTVYSQTIKKVCDRALISPELSHKVCGAFWRAVYDEEPPLPMPGQSEKQPPEPPAPVLSAEGMYQKGQDCENQKHYGEAVKWYRMAAEQGNPFAQYHLSRQYESGNGVEKDLSQATYWCRKAADKHIPGAQEQLGRLEAKLAAQTKPSPPPVPPAPPAPKPQPAKRTNFALYRPEHSKQERWLLILGWACLVHALLFWVYCIINGQSSVFVSFAIIALMFFLPVLKGQLLLWQRVKNWKPQGIGKRLLYRIWEVEGFVFGFCEALMLVWIPLFYFVAPEIPAGYNIILCIFPLYGIYHVWWYLWWRRLKA